MERSSVRNRWVPVLFTHPLSQPGFSLCCWEQICKLGGSTLTAQLDLQHLDHLEEDFSLLSLLYSCTANHRHCFTLPLEVRMVLDSLNTLPGLLDRNVLSTRTPRVWSRSLLPGAQVNILVLPGLELWVGWGDRGCHYRSRDLTLRTSAQLDEDRTVRVTWWGSPCLPRSPAHEKPVQECPSHPSILLFSSWVALWLQAEHLELAGPHLPCEPLLPLRFLCLRPVRCGCEGCGCPEVSCPGPVSSLLPLLWRWVPQPGVLPQTQHF